MGEIAPVSRREIVSFSTPTAFATTAWVYPAHLRASAIAAPTRASSSALWPSVFMSFLRVAKNDTDENFRANRSLKNNALRY